jgi:hypothetical protein
MTAPTFDHRELLIATALSVRPRRFGGRRASRRQPLAEAVFGYFERHLLFFNYRFEMQSTLCACLLNH